MIRSIIVSILFMILGGSVRLSAANIEIHSHDSIPVMSDSLQRELAQQVIQLGFSKDENSKKKLVSAIFAFPFPFGFMGAHRVMLGTSPWVPVVYVATFGGCFGILPLIDFCVIVLSKDISEYENNPHVFMWVK